MESLLGSYEFSSKEEIFRNSIIYNGLFRCECSHVDKVHAFGIGECYYEDCDCIEVRYKEKIFLFIKIPSSKVEKRSYISLKDFDAFLRLNIKSLIKRRSKEWWKFWEIYLKGEN